MKVLVVHNFYQQSGGEDGCFEAECEMLRSYGHEVIQHCAHNDDIKDMSRLSVAARTIWSRPSYREFRTLFQTHCPDVVHFHNTFPLISPSAYYAARAEHVPVVQTLHNFRILCPSALFFRDGQVCEDCLGKSIPWAGIKHKCYRESRSASLGVAAMTSFHRMIGTWKNAVNRYIALTEFSRKKFIDGGLPAEKIAVKPNFVLSDPGAGRGLGSYAIFVGRLSQEKGIGTLLQSWEAGNVAMPLKIVGDGPLAATVAEATGRCPNIEWLGKQSSQSVAELLANAACLVLPSQCYENFPRVAVEAMAAGTPVIASRLGAMAEIVDHGRTGLLFAPGDAADLAKAVHRVMVNQSELQHMRQNARDEFEQKYTAAINHELLIGIYEQACGVRSMVQLADEPADHRVSLPVTIGE